MDDEQDFIHDILNPITIAKGKTKNHLLFLARYIPANKAKAPTGVKLGRWGSKRPANAMVIAKTKNPMRKMFWEVNRDFKNAIIL